MSEFCPVCEGIDIDVQTSYRGSHALFNGMSRAHCGSCGIVFATPMPDMEALEEYNAGYFSSAHGGLPNNLIAIAFFSSMARIRMAHLEKFLHLHHVEVSSLVEFGPGAGFFAQHWLVQYPQTKYFAVETDSSCHAFLKKVGVQLIAFSAIREEKRGLDMVVMSHVLEHVTNPIQFIKDATHHLRQGGALFIEVPCRDWEHKTMDEPHLLFFDKGPMYQLLDQLGFEHIELSYHGQTIDKLKSTSVFQSKLMSVRN